LTDTVLGFDNLDNRLVRIITVIILVGLRSLTTVGGLARIVTKCSWILLFGNLRAASDCPDYVTDAVSERLIASIEFELNHPNLHPSLVRGLFIARHINSPFIPASAARNMKASRQKTRNEAEKQTEGV
jgi:hypothetical protein